MRKIEFRARIINSESYPEMNGEWFYGYYMQDLSQGVIKHYIYNCPVQFEINPETLEQFTGRVDDKGDKIFELTKEKKENSIVTAYRNWKIENPDEGYQYDMVEEFLADFSRGDIQSLLEELI